MEGQPVRADDNEESLETHLVGYNKKTSSLIGVYRAKGQLRWVPDLGEIDELADGIESILYG